MFRGGPVSSYGTGIASGLGYESGGRVAPDGRIKFNVAGLVSPGMAAEYARGQGTLRSPTIQNYSRPIGPPSGSLRGPMGSPFTRTTGRLGGAFRFPMLSSALSRFAIPALSTTAGLASIPIAGVGGLAYLNRPKNLEALQIMKDEPASTFDETNIDDFDSYTKRLVEAEKGDSEKISFADALFMDPQTKTYPKIFGRTEDREKLQKIKDEKQKADNAIVEDFEVSGESLPGTGGKNLDVVGRVLDVAEKKVDAGKILDNASILNKQNTANEELTIEEIKDTLGYAKARRRDVGDMLGRASAAFLGEGDVRSGLAKFMDAESRSGPGRAEKIETAAATFLLKDKQQTKQNKAMIDQLKAKIDYQIERGDEISIEKSILAATKGGTGSNKEIARGIQGGTSPNTGKKYKFAGVVTKQGLKDKIGNANFGDTFIVQEKVKDSITGADTTARIIVEIQRDGSAKPIYNLG
tara:strand:- start:113 stop:1513 length:1401 start_codon:yes stop_codon:yes gene_type:complete